MGVIGAPFSKGQVRAQRLAEARALPERVRVQVCNLLLPLCCSLAEEWSEDPTSSEPRDCCRDSANKVTSPTVVASVVVPSVVTL